MAHLRYGPLNPGCKTVMMPVAASQFFRHDGPNAVYLDSSGHVTLALTATATLWGVAIVPAGRGAGTSDDYWKSSATAGYDKIPVVPISENEYFLCKSDGTPTASQAGNACDLIAVNDGTATTVDIGTSSTDVFLIVGRGVDFKKDAATADVVIQLNPAKRQADT